MRGACAVMTYRQMASFQFDTPADVICTGCKITLGTAGDLFEATAMAESHRCGP